MISEVTEENQIENRMNTEDFDSFCKVPSIPQKQEEIFYNLVKI